MTDIHLRQIVYTSKACPDADTDAILHQSRRNNARDGVTGLLYAGDAGFMQAIEGDAAVTGGTFDRIRADDRHTDVEVLADREIAAREFGQWSMALADDAQMRAALATAPPALRARFREVAGD